MLLGAGASACFGLPVQANLLKQARKAAGATVWGDRLKYLERYAPFGTDVEEILTTIEIANANRDNATLLYEDAPWLDWNTIVAYITTPLLLKRSRLQRGLAIYCRFLQLLQRAYVTFISLNYDLYLEAALVEFGWRPDYAFPFDLLRDFPVEDSAKLVTVLKPHGSLNWGFCWTCCTLHCSGLVEHPALRADVDMWPTMLDGWRWSGETSMVNLPECVTGPGEHVVRVPLVVPSRLKPTSLAPTDTLGRRTNAAVAAADALVFVGCSLREADVDLRYFLTSALRKNAGIPVPVFCFAGPDTRNNIRRFLGPRAKFYKGVGPALPLYLDETGIDQFEEWCGRVLI